MNKVRRLIRYKYAGVLPEPRLTKEERAEWDLRIALAKYFGLTERKVLAMAKAEYQSSVQEQIGKGCGGWEKWEKDCESWRKYLFVSGVLPDIEKFTDTETAGVVLLVRKKRGGE